MSAATSTADDLARRVVDKLVADDAFSRWLGIEIVEAAARRSVIRMTVRAEMTNGFGICHGGVTFAFADSALAFACNSHGSLTVALENNIGFPAAVHVGDVLTAVAEGDAVKRRAGFYSVRVTNQRDEPVAIFRGTVYDTGRPHFPEPHVDRPT
jgi:acyl-CoA thioesterase